MLVTFISEFTDYLNQEGFDVPESKIQNFLRMAAAADFDITDESAVASALGLTLSGNREEYRRMKGLFRDFMSNRERIRKAAEERKEKKARADSMVRKLSEDEERAAGQAKSFEKKKAQLSSRIQDIEGEKGKRAAKIRKEESEKAPKPLFTAKKAAQLTKDLGRPKFPSQRSKDLASQMLSGKTLTATPIEMD